VKVDKILTHDNPEYRVFRRFMRQLEHLLAAIIVAGFDIVPYLQSLPGMQLHQLEHIECLVCHVNYLESEW